MSLTLVLILILVFIAAYFAGRARSVAVASPLGGVKRLNSLPFYYGALASLWCVIPAIFVVIVWSVFDDLIIKNLIVSHFPPEISKSADIDLVYNKICNIAEGNALPIAAPDYVLSGVDHFHHLGSINRWSLLVLMLIMATGGLAYAWSRIQPDLRARVHVETVFRWSLLLCSSIAILTTVGIVLSVLFESIRFFKLVPITDFLFGTQWSPQIALREDQQGSSGSFGAVPLFTGTLIIATIALIVAVPTGLMSAIYLSEYASKRMRDLLKPILEVLAGVPTVVYGFFAALTVAPFIRDLGINLGLDQYMAISSESALAAGLVMGVMIIPFVSSLSDDVINAVPQSLRDGSLGLGSTRSEMIRQVVVPAALPGIVGGVLLAASRAIGETMIVVMAAGLAANLTANPLDSVTTVTVQIVTLLVGDQEFDSPKTLAAFALGLVLFLVTLGLNYLALHIVRKYREQYE